MVQVNKFDRRNDPETQKLFERLGLDKDKTLVGAADLQEIVKVMDALPKLEFPIHSAGELIEKLGGSGKMLEIVGVSVNPVRMVKYVPTHYFPITTLENFIEKMAELIRINRKKIDVPKELAHIKSQLPLLQYPIANLKELSRMVGTRDTYRFQGGTVITREIINRVPENIFPIASQEDFDRKISKLMVTRPLIVKD